MATLEALRHYFDSPMQDSSFLDALTARLGRKMITPVDLDAITEFFGELHFKEKPLEGIKDDDVASSPVLSEENPAACVAEEVSEDKNLSVNSDPSPPAVALKSMGGSFTRKSNNLELCTEGLGSESCGDVEEPIQNLDYCKRRGSRYAKYFDAGFLHRRSRIEKFPPPISSIGRNGQPWVSFKSYREDGRFILREIRIPNQEFLHASREDGRLKLRFVQRDDEIETVEEQTEDDDDVQEEAEGDYDDVQADDGGDDCNENGRRTMLDFVNVSTL